MTDNLPAVFTREGRGHAGFCKVCASSIADEVNKRLKAKQSVLKVIRWADGMGLSVSRPTMYAHRDHIKDPRVTFVEQARNNPVIKGVTTREYLEAIRDSAAAKAVQYPELVTIQDGLKAAQILLQDKKGMEGITLVLMKVFTGQAEDVIEGEYREVKEVTESG